MIRLSENLHVGSLLKGERDINILTEGKLSIIDAWSNTFLDVIVF